VLVCASVALVANPSSEIYAVELVVLSFAVLYGFAVWPVLPTMLSIGGFVTLTAAVMIPRVLDGALPAAELIEVVVPAVLAGCVIFHVRRREQALERVRRLAEVERRRAAARERLSRMTSHELRTPLTVAGGYVDRLLDGETDAERREDLTTVHGEIRQLSRVTDRLVRAVAMDLGAPDQPTELGPVLAEVERRWSGVVERELVVDCTVAAVPVNADRLQAALDTLVENAVRYTADGDSIRLFATETAEGTAVGVADSGAGLSPALLAHVNAAADHDIADTERPPAATSAGGLLRDTYSQTGFGLRLVASVASTAGGRLVASESPEGGAQLAIVIGPGDPGRQRTTTVSTTVRSSEPDVAVRSTV
jgi:two-component system OmpR family sensor kinase